MSSTTFPMATDAFSFDRTISDMKQGVASATSAQTDVTAKATQAGKDFAVFSQGSMEAIMHASQVFAAGSQDLLRQMTEAGQTAMHEMLAGVRAIAAAKTPKAMLELQANFARTSAIQAITESARIAHAGVDLAERVSAPLLARTVAAAEMATTHRA